MKLLDTVAVDDSITGHGTQGIQLQRQWPICSFLEVISRQCPNLLHVTQHDTRNIVLPLGALAALHAFYAPTHS